MAEKGPRQFRHATEPSTRSNFNQTWSGFWKHVIIALPSEPAIIQVLRPDHRPYFTRYRMKQLTDISRASIINIVISPTTTNRGRMTLPCSGNR